MSLCHNILVALIAAKIHLKQLRADDAMEFFASFSVIDIYGLFIIRQIFEEKFLKCQLVSRLATHLDSSEH